MAKNRTHEPRPMPYAKARHLLNPLRSLILSPEKLVQRLDLSPDFRVLELGPGPGYFKLGDPDFIPWTEMIRSVQAAGFCCCATYDNFLSYTVNFRRLRPFE